MATAGRILIMPKGPWAAETEYEMLDLVNHKGRSWIAKKVSVGIEPSADTNEYWHDLLGAELTPETIGALSMNGGTVNGEVYAESFEATNTTYTQMRLKQTDNKTKLVLQNAGTVADFILHETTEGADDYRGLRLCSAQHNDLENALVLRSVTNGAEIQSVVFGQHNKPNGSYMGNGSATERQINIGGLGEILCIRYGSFIGFVTQSGMWYIANDGTSGYFDTSVVSFVNGVLTIVSNHKYLNASGFTYSFCVL